MQCKVISTRRCAGGRAFGTKPRQATVSNKQLNNSTIASLELLYAQATVLEGRGHNDSGCLVLVSHKAAVTASAVCGVVAWAIIDEVILPWSLVKRGALMEQGIILCMVVRPGGEDFFHFYISFLW